MSLFAEPHGGERLADALHRPLALAVPAKGERRQEQIRPVGGDASPCPERDIDALVPSGGPDDEMCTYPPGLAHPDCEEVQMADRISVSAA